MQDREPKEPPATAGNAGVWRAIDASANRAGEALRVLEDVVRFGLDDERLTAVAKNLRHDLAGLLATGPLRHRVAARDVASDVGTGIEAAATLRRASVADLVAANAARAGQALRSLAEMAAVVAPETAAGFERLRYRLYDLDRDALAAANARERLAGVTLCVLVDGRRDAAAFAALVETLFDAGVRMIQLRDKALGVPALAERARAAVALARRHADRTGERPLVVVNDRADLAAAVGAAGVHTGADDLPTALARRVIGPGGLLGRTAHDLDEARAAAGAGADYLGIGPCFPSATKAFGAFAPREFLERVARSIALPAYAIGGITVERLDELAALGIRRVAVGAAVTAAADPAAAARALIERLEHRAAARLGG
jgi:thiamine-phosphate pyrophosphorylase